MIADEPDSARLLHLGELRHHRARTHSAVRGRSEVTDALVVAIQGASEVDPHRFGPPAPRARSPRRSWPRPRRSRRWTSASTSTGRSTSPSPRTRTRSTSSRTASSRPARASRRTALQRQGLPVRLPGRRGRRSTSATSTTRIAGTRATRRRCTTSTWSSTATKLCTGSYNLSDNAEHNTFENMCCSAARGTPSWSAQFEANFESIWETGPRRGPARRPQRDHRERRDHPHRLPSDGAHLAGGDHAQAAHPQRVPGRRLHRVPAERGGAPDLHEVMKLELGPLRVTAAGGSDRQGGGDGPAVLLCHGFGAPGDDLVPFARVVDAGARRALVLPRGAAGAGSGWGVAGRAWWHIDMVRLQEEMMRGRRLCAGGGGAGWAGGGARRAGGMHRGAVRAFRGGP